MTRALNRSIPFWLLLVLSIGLSVAGTLVVFDHLGTMTATLKDGSATGLEVYAGQSWIVIGAALLGAGALGVLLALALAVASTLIASATAAPVEIAPLDFDAADDADDEDDPEGALDAPAPAPQVAPAGSVENAEDSEPVGEPQNGSSGSTATATKINVR